MPGAAAHAPGADPNKNAPRCCRKPPARPRTGFWAFLSQVWRFTGVPIWAAQGAAAALFFLAAAGQKDLVSWLPLLGPLLVAVCLPVLFAGQRYDMDELEASTCVSRAELALAKLVLAAAADLVLLTSALALGSTRTGEGSAAAVFLSAGSFFVLCDGCLDRTSTLSAEQWDDLYRGMFRHGGGTADDSSCGAPTV